MSYTVTSGKTGIVITNTLGRRDSWYDWRGLIELNSFMHRGETLADIKLTIKIKK